MAYPTGDLATQMASMSMQPIQRAGDSPLLAMFGQGNIIGLTSPLSNSNVTVSASTVQATGGNEQEAQFIVHVRQPGIVALQSIKNHLDWLAIFEGKVIGNGRGGPFSDFSVLDYGNFVTLNSTQYQGQRIAFYSNGQVMPFHEVPADVPNQPNTPASLIPFVHHYAGQVNNPEMSSAPPQPVNCGYQQPPPGSYSPSQPHGTYPPAQGVPPPQNTSYPAPQGVPPQQGTYPPAQGVPPQGTFPAAQGVPPQQGMPPQQAALPPAALPTGFNVLDAFRPNNVIALICKANGKHVNVTKGDQHATGRFNNKESLFTVTIAGNGGAVLQNVNWPGLYLGIKGKKGTVQNKSDSKHASLKFTALPDNYVYFESMESPGSFLGFDSAGKACNPKEVGPNDPSCQFFIRVEKQRHITSIPTTPYQRPSIYTYVRDESIIQLYLKGTTRYLAIDKNGHPGTITNPNDQYSFFIWKDRGMGIVSLLSYKARDGFMMRMGGFVVSGKGDADLNSDFRVHETIGGGVKFESVTCPGGFLAIDNNKVAVQEMFIQMITIQKFGRSETITKQAIN